MLDFDSCIIDDFIVHRVGNKSEEEGYIASEELHELNEELNYLLKRLFFKSFKGVNHFFKFHHPSSLDLNEMNVFSREIFEGGDLVEQSQNILKHLYDQSVHPHIKSGELLIAKFSQVINDDEVFDAIGVFKIERKDEFIKFRDSLDQGLLIDIFKGVNLNKLDKGCFIFDTNQEDGYKIAVVDSNNYDTQYWMEDFLGAQVFEDKHFHTKNALDVCKQFADDVIKPNNDAIEHAAFMNESLQFFQNEEVFNMEQFAEQVIKEPEYKDEFKSFTKSFEENKGVTVNEQFDIAPVAVKEAKRKMKNVIDLDTNMQIKLDFNNPESAYNFLERGYDQSKGMYFYKVYFNREEK